MKPVDGLLRELDMGLDELLERSTAIELAPLPGVSVKLSRFTAKQLSRANPLKRVKPGRRKAHYNTRRRKRREASRTMWQMYHRFKQKYGSRWQVTKEDWQEQLWPYVRGRRLRLGSYSRGDNLNIYTVWIEDAQTGEKLWEGAEELLRLNGYSL